MEEAEDEALEMRHMRQELKRKLFRRAPEPLRLGRFVVLERLGEGGMGVVFSGYDPTLDRKVAIKVLRSQPGELGDRQRLRTMREAQALARLSHANVIAVFEVGELDGAVFIVMEFIRGVTLKDWLASTPRAPAEVLAVLVAAGRGLVAAHQAGLIHRDFKPDNVMVGDDGSVRVLDFGLAALEASPAEAVTEASPDFDPASPASDRLRLTRTGVKVGTPAYMAPEQWAGAPPDARGDQYSFCAVLHEALTGVRPNAGVTLAALERAESPPRPAPRSELPAWLRAAVQRGLARAPEQRFASLSQLIDLLARDPERRQRRQRAAQIVAAVMLTALIALGLVRGAAAL
ncbi:MAG TPA: serine/threonine-protein kinase, partial [Nannocystis sp.]